MRTALINPTENTTPQTLLQHTGSPTLEHLIANAGVWYAAGETDDYLRAAELSPHTETNDLVGLAYSNLIIPPDMGGRVNTEALELLIYEHL